MEPSGELPPIEEGIAPLPIPYTGPQVMQDDSPVVPEPGPSLGGVWDSIKAGYNKVDHALWPPIEEVMPKGHFQAEAQRRKDEAAAQVEAQQHDEAIKAARLPEDSLRHDVKSEPMSFSGLFSKIGNFFNPHDKALVDYSEYRKNPGQWASVDDYVAWWRAKNPNASAYAPGQEPEPEHSSAVGMGDVKLADRALVQHPADAPVDRGVDSKSSKQSMSVMGPALSKVSGPQMKDLDVGTGTINTLDNLRHAEQARDNVQLGNKILKGLELAGSGISRSEAVGQKTFDENIKGAEGIVSDFKDRGEQEKNDPKSPASNAFREYAKRFGINIKGDFSAAMGEKMMPMIFKEYEMEENRKARKEEMQFKYSQLKAQKELAAGDKKTKQNIDMTKDIQKQMTTGKIGGLYEFYMNSKRTADAFNNFINNPKGQNGYQDYAILMGGLKTLQGDSSVVRESEQRAGANATGLLNKALNYLDRLKSGKTLQPSQRQEMTDTINVWTNAGKKQYLDATNKYYNQAKRHELSLPDIFDHPADYEGYGSAPQEGGNSKPDVTQNGHTYKWNATKNKYE